MLSKALRTFSKAHPVAFKAPFTVAALPIFAFSKFNENIHNDSSKQQSPQQGATCFSEDSSMNSGPNALLRRVYKTTGFGIVGTLTISQLVILSGLVYTNPFFCVLGGCVMALGGILGTSFVPPKQYIEETNGQTYLKSSNAPLRVGLYGLGMAGLGLLSSVLFGALNITNPAILPLSIGITGAVFGSAWLYAYIRPKGTFLILESSFFAGLFGFFGIQLAGILTQLYIDPNTFTLLCHNVDSYIGVSIFTALVAYYTDIAITNYQAGNADHLGISIRLPFLVCDFFFQIALNLFLHIKD